MQAGDIEVEKIGEILVLEEVTVQMTVQRYSVTRGIHGSRVTSVTHESRVISNIMGRDLEKMSGKLMIEQGLASEGPVFS